VIVISGTDGAAQINAMSLTQFETDIVRKKYRSSAVYQYDSVETLAFELRTRRNIVQAALDFDASGVKFSTFTDAHCNGQYWSLSEIGGFRLRRGVPSSEGIRDIFRNGPYYASECSTTVIIILYKGVLDTIGDETFNKHFQNLYLRDWNYDVDMRLIFSNNKHAACPGDVLYFKNPGFAPERPEWHGQNVVMIGDNLFYGHPMRIKTAQGIIAAVNRKRRPWSLTSAYMANVLVYPDFAHLRRLTLTEETPDSLADARGNGVFAYVGSRKYAL